MREYILSICAAAIMASILGALAGKGTVGSLLKMLSGLFLAVTVMGPLVRLELPDPASWIEDYSSAGRAAAEAGEELASEYAASIISAELEAYILDKAAILGADLEVEVSLDSSGIPKTVTLIGKVPPDAREELSRCLDRELGIGEEAQAWVN